MALTSFNFLLFFFGVLVLYYLIPRKYQWFLLLAASYCFYLFSGVGQILYILGTTAVSYGSARLMQKHRDACQDQIDALGSDITKEQKKQLKKQAAGRIHTIQVVTVLINLAVLAYVKYLNFFIGNLNSLFSLFAWDASIPLTNILAPLGISYYTFNSIGYLIDVGRGRYRAETHLGKFALFVSFFPSIVQGPLNRYSDLGMQLQQPHELNYDNLKFGAQLMLWGFFKKLVIADQIASIAGTIFSPDYHVAKGAEVFLGVIAYSFQIYGDFSGGVDITRGAAQMLGIILPNNFQRPFFATSMADFWRRWHMSLGNWMKEYVFFPVMVSKPVASASKFFRKRFGAYAGKVVPSVAAPLVVFFLIGIWHGITWQYIVNGLYNALIIASSVALEPVYKKTAEKLRVNTEAFSFRLFRMLRTLVLVCISRVITRAPSLGEAVRMLKLVIRDRVFLSIDGLDFISGASGEIFSYGVSEKEMFVLFLALLVLLAVSILQESGMKIRETLAKQNLLFRWMMILLLLLVVLVFGVYGPEYDARAFIYGGF